MKFLKPGDVLVLKGEEFGECALTGDLMMGMAKNSRVRAFINDTHIRDRDGLAGLDIAFFANGLNLNGPYKSGPGKIGLPISIGGHMVESGDVTVGDSDNVAVVKRREIDALLADLQGTTEKKKALEAAIANGAKYMGLRMKRWKASR